MIDFYDIDISFIPLGREDWLRLPGHESVMQPASRQQIKLRNPAWASQQTALMFADSFRLMVCPAKVLGRWNTYGSDDLRAIVLETAPLVLKAMGIDVTPKIMESLARGEYKVRELHIAHQFWLPDYDIGDFLDCVCRRLNESHFPQRLPRGRGFFLSPESRTAVYLFYDKELETRRKGRPFYDHRMADTKAVPLHSWKRAGLALDRDKQRVLAAAGPRLEIRLRDQFFRGNALERGRNWRPDIADSIFRQKLGGLQLPRVVNATYARNVARRRAGKAYGTYLLWAAGSRLDDIGLHQKTVGAHRKILQDALRLDIRQPASSVLGNRAAVDAAAVFAWDNRVIAEAVDLEEMAWLGDDFQAA